MTILTAIGCAIVAGILIYGIGGFGGGKMTPQKQNKVMQWRIGAQFLAVILLVVAALAAAD